MEVGDRESQGVRYWQCLRSTKLCQNDVAHADCDYAVYDDADDSEAADANDADDDEADGSEAADTDDDDIGDDSDDDADDCEAVEKLTTAAPPKMRKGKERSRTPRPAMNGAMKHPILNIRRMAMLLLLIMTWGIPIEKVIRCC